MSNSFLELAEKERCTVEDLDPEAVAEFLCFGSLFFGKTYFKTIKKMSHDDILRISCSDGNISFLKKNSLDLDAVPDAASKTFEEYFEKLALSLGNCNVSVDLTGGVDTRLVAVMLDHYGLRFETASSGGTADYEDISFSVEVAQALRHTWFGTVHSVDSLEKDMYDVFLATEGLYDVLYYHRLYQLQNARRMRGVNAIISGVGGELFKDYWWLHEFPFYSRKKSDIRRLVDLRIMSSEFTPGLLTERFDEAGAMIRGNLIKELSRYTLDTNTKTYDNIFFNVMMRDIAGRVLTSHGNYVRCYAPFLDLDLARLGYRLPRKERLFNLFHRKKLTCINPSIARLKTTECGISASYSLMDMARDLPRYGSEKIGRLLIKLGFLDRKKFAHRNHPDFYGHVRTMDVMEDSLSVLKDIGIIRRDVETGQLEDGYLGNVLSIGMLVRHIQKHN